jgi:sporulation protein YlmC with PRC-barrel domain
MGIRAAGLMEDFLQRAVLMNGIYIGRVVDVILDAEGGSAVGLEVRCEDGRHRFLPLAAARLGAEAIEIDSPLALMDGDQLDFYRERGATLRVRREPAAEG